jgi:hypothetical protein
MMPSPHDEQKLTVAQSINSWYAIGIIVSTAFTPFLRAHFGYAVFAWTGPICLVGLIFYGGLARIPFILNVYIPAWLLMVIVRRITADKRETSDYRGRLMFIPNQTVGRIIEIAIMSGIGYFFQNWAKGMSHFAYAGAMSLGLVFVLERMAQAAKIRQMEDAFKQQGIQADLFRRVRR